MNLAHVWVYLETTPLLGLACTLVAWQAAVALSRLLGNAAMASPVLLAIVMLVALLLATGTSYGAYFQGAQYVHFLLGPATVALAVPMHDNWSQIRRSAPALVPALLAGSVTAAATAMLVARALGGSRVIVLSLAPKSVTTPIAMGVSEQIGGAPSLTAVFVLITGLVAIGLVGPVMRLVRVRDWRAFGLGGRRDTGWRRRRCCCSTRRQARSRGWRSGSTGWSRRSSCRRWRDGLWGEVLARAARPGLCPPRRDAGLPEDEPSGGAAGSRVRDRAGAMRPGGVCGVVGGQPLGGYARWSRAAKFRSTPR